MKLYNFNKQTQPNKGLVHPKRRKLNVRKKIKKNPKISINFSNINVFSIIHKNFYLQIGVFFLLTVSVIAAFQSVKDLTPDTRAESKENAEVRIISDFDTTATNPEKKNKKSPNLIAVEKPKPEETEITPKSPPQKEEDLTPTSNDNKPNLSDQKKTSSNKENTLFYTVKPGDTLSTIANLFGIKSKELIELNPEVNFNNLKVDQKIAVPVSV
jgi:LysM repeat protein